jgi:outer membrane protein
MKVIKSCALALTVALGATIGLAEQSAAGDYSGNFMVKAGVTGVLPNSEFEGLSINGFQVFNDDIAEVDDSWVPSITLTYFVNKNIGIELFCCFAQHGVEAKGNLAALGLNDLGETMIFPPILSLQYHFDGMRGIKPYVGAGVQFIHFFDTHSEIGGDLDIDSAWGFSLQGGVDVELGGGWYAGADVRYTWLDSTATFTNALGGVPHIETDFDLDPLLVSAHVGYRFNLFGRRTAAMEPLK